MKRSVGLRHVCIGYLVAQLLKQTLSQLYCSLLQLAFLLAECPNAHSRPASVNGHLALLSEPAGACPPAVHTLVVTPIAPHDRELRRAIRDTWHVQFDRRFSRTLFVSGVTADARLNDALLREARAADDMLVFDFADSYHNLTLKLVNALKWAAERCSPATTVLRADADTVVSARNLDAFVGGAPLPSTAVYGYCRSDDCVMRLPFSKGCMSRRAHAASWYPRYCFGFGYLLSVAALRTALDRLPEHTPYFPLDDIFITGILGRSLGKISHPSLFDYRTPFDRLSCRNGRIVSGGYSTPNALRSAWQDNQISLFEHVDTALLRQPTYEKFRRLLNNYNRQTGVAERVTSTEAQETRDFFDEVYRTRVMQETYNFLHRKRHPLARTSGQFRDALWQLWFGAYSRARGVADTTGFEHVFMGEAKNGEVGGLHNWLRFYQLERATSERFDYKGYLVKRGQVLAAVKFHWRDEVKRSSTFMVGTSPEFDFAVYSLCFLTNRGNNHECHIELDGCDVSIKSHESRQSGRVFIGSVFPRAGRMTDACRRRIYPRT